MLGDTIKTLRNRKGITQEELAVAIGVTTAAIQHYEENNWRPGVNIIVRIADILQVPVTELFKGCKAIYDLNGDILIVEENCGCHIKVKARISKNQR